MTEHSHASPDEGDRSGHGSAVEQVDHGSSHGHAGTGEVERHCDVAVVGGSAAGLAAALQLGRQRRSVIVVDAGEPRNAPADHLHSYLGHDGLPPSELTRIGREEVRRYGGEVLDGRVSSVSRLPDDRFALELVGGHRLVSRRVLVATGLRDLLPHVEGIEEHWGRDVIHCPFCHGYEVRDRPIVQLVTQPVGLHAARLFRQLTAQLTVVVDPSIEVPSDELEELVAAGVTVLSDRGSRIIEHPDGSVAGVELVDHGTVACDVIAVSPTVAARAEAFAPLGLRAGAHPSGMGQVVAVDATGATDVAGVYAAGNVVDPSHQLLQAAADGSRTGAMIAGDLASEEVRTASRPSPAAEDWDRRYGDEPRWSGNPNGTLVEEVTGLAPGRALDVGAGEGGDALFLAEQGWEVTATDVSNRALERADAEARRRGLDITFEVADANAFAPFAPRAYDLVTAFYASIPRSADDRAARNLLAAVRPGGTLLVVGHDLEPMRAPIDTTVQSRAFDPDAHVRVDDVAALVEREPDWEIEVHEVRPRPGGAVSSHHVDDVVLRARRIR